MFDVYSITGVRSSWIDKKMASGCIALYSVELYTLASTADVIFNAGTFYETNTPPTRLSHKWSTRLIIVLGPGGIL